MASIPTFGLCVALHHPRESARDCLFGRKANVGGFVHVSRNLGAFGFQKEKLFAPEIVRICGYVSTPRSQKSNPSGGWLPFPSDRESSLPAKLWHGQEQHGTCMIPSPSPPHGAPDAIRDEVTMGFVRIMGRRAMENMVKGPRFLFPTAATFSKPQVDVSI